MRPEGAAILVQDYHLCLLAPALVERRPDLRIVHFSHTPFAAPELLAVLPTPGAASCSRAWPRTTRAASTRRAGPPTSSPRARSPASLRRPRSWPRSAPTPTTWLPRPPPTPAVPRAPSSTPSSAAGALVPASTGSSCRRTCCAASTPSTCCSRTTRSGASRWSSRRSSTRRREGLSDYLAYRAGGRGAGAAAQREVGHARLDADPLRRQRQLPALGGGPATLRRAARQPHPRRPEPGGQGGDAGQRARRPAGA